MINSYRGQIGCTEKKLRFVLNTDCNLRCKYCHHEGILQKAEKSIDPEELFNIAQIGAYYGFDKVRLTGGEPLLLGEKLFEIISRLHSLGNVSEVSLITNGLLLSAYAKNIIDSRLTEISVSLPSLRRTEYAFVTGVDCLENVTNAIQTVAGCNPITLNVVVIKGVNDSPNKIDEFISYCAKNRFSIRFIEMLAFPFNRTFYNEYFSPMSAVEAHVKKRGTLRGTTRWGVKDFDVDGIVVRCMKCSCTGEFCSLCSDTVDLFVTPDGKLKPCMLRDDNLLEMPSLSLEPRARMAMMKEVFARAIQSRPPYTGTQKK